MLDLTGKSVAILGAGRSGQAAAALASHCGAEVTIYDSRDVPGATLATPEFALKVKSDLVVVSPGIETLGDFVQSFAKGSEALWGEVELAWRCYSGHVIGITGTNGKTTTTELVRELVEVTGKSCVACGNYGVPLSEVVLYDFVPDVVALELSSFQLETIVDFKPDAVVWLNFSPDHMDRYKAVSEYREAKLRILENISDDTLVVSRLGENLPPKGQLVTFSSVDSADWSLSGDDILKNGESFLKLSETKLRGLHNAENLMAACAILPQISQDQVRSALAKYSPPEHRCEFIAEKKGVEYLNDSKATNLHALESALRSQTRPTILIAGGKEKGLDYTPILPLLKEQAKEVVTFGEIGKALSQVFSQTVPVTVVETLAEAVVAAAELSQEGDLVLLSPGTSSFDQFRGYEDRGQAFKAAVTALPA